MSEDLMGEKKLGFAYEPQPVDDKGREIIAEIRKSFDELDLFLRSRCIDSRIKSIALTELEGASMWAIKAVTHGNNS